MNEKKGLSHHQSNALINKMDPNELYKKIVVKDRPQGDPHIGTISEGNFDDSQALKTFYKQNKDSIERAGLMTSRTQGR